MLRDMKSNRIHFYRGNHIHKCLSFSILPFAIFLVFFHSFCQKENYKVIVALGRLGGKGHDIHLNVICPW